MIELENSFGERKKVKVGYSWTVLFFGWLVPIIRKDFKWFIIMFVAQIFVGMIAVDIAVVVNIIMFAIYNKMYINDLIAKGYRPTTYNAEKLLKSKGIYF